jgi:ABC-type uncharacterized transport system substrate-binding protein
MLRILHRLILPALLTLALTGAASAHPHVWVIIKSDLVYAADGTVTSVRHHWTFDEMFSTFAIQGMDTKKPGGLTREELAPLAEVNITSLKDFQYFTQARADGKKPAFVDPKEYWLEHKDGALTLHFTLPLEKPVKAKQLDLEIFDSSYFVDFSLAEKEPAALVGAPAQCKLATRGARDGATASAPPPNEAFFQGLDASSNFGAQFANKIAVTCP